MSELLETALSYAARGWQVFPCWPPAAAACRDKELRKRGKTPACAHGINDATADPSTVKGWWRDTDFNIGIATGKKSGFWVLDIDGADGEAELRNLEGKFGALPPTLESITGSGGRHLCFRIENYSIRNSTSAFAPKIDIRATGGYIIAPPSLHGLGKKYAWSVDSTDEPAAAPEWVITRAVSANFTARAATPLNPADQKKDWAELYQSTVGEGARNDSVTRLAGYFLCRGLDPTIVLDMMQRWNDAHCAPPLPEREVEGTVVSIARKELSKKRPGFGRQ
jgi:Bifunctional DNA primase/polymerase, N-terminal/Primase C terminal 1 (PriCT-1)